MTVLLFMRAAYCSGSAHAPVTLLPEQVRLCSDRLLAVQPWLTLPQML